MKWTKKLFFHLTDLTILNSYILLTSCGAKQTHRDFRLRLVLELVEQGGRQTRPSPRVGRPMSSRVARLEESDKKHWWPTISTTRMNCTVCYNKNMKRRRRIQTKCEKCNIGLCISGCFKDYHTKLQF
ncbi:PiggyBac transposable element-derived protein 4 [Blattella germanica]|nr:PiggyBac transposable element-derived protein 4 [Blattella germanica]PSN55837.1 PiggyBac transposable element-derived protein 4 [Blattella germanica]PSN55838.1 PiggyBac transposable element-derived protein 4 [Blattella germanica]